MTLYLMLSPDSLGKRFRFWYYISLLLSICILLLFSCKPCMPIRAFQLKYDSSILTPHHHQTKLIDLMTNSFINEASFPLHIHYSICPYLFYSSSFLSPRYLARCCGRKVERKYLYFPAGNCLRWFVMLLDGWWSDGCETRYDVLIGMMWFRCMSVM